MLSLCAGSAHLSRRVCIFGCSMRVSLPSVRLNICVGSLGLPCLLDSLEEISCLMDCEEFQSRISQSRDVTIIFSFIPN